MAFPVVEATNTGGAAGTRSYDVPLPSGIQAGELLLMFILVCASSGRTITTPSGWTQLYHESGGGNARRAGCYYRVATGGEGSTVPVSANSGSQWATTSYRISGYSAVPEASSVASGSSSSADPPTLSPSWDAVDTLWIAAVHHSPFSTEPAPPTNYGDQITGISPAVNQTARTATALRYLNAASENPGAFSLGASVGWAAATVAVPGFDSGAARQMMHYRRLRI